MFTVIRLVLLRFFESFFRHIWLYLLPIVLLTTLAIVYLLTKPPQYLSWGTFYIQDESLLSSLNALRDRGFSYDTPSEIATAEISELFNSASFMRAVAQQTKLEEKMAADRKTVEETLNEMRKTIWADSTGERMVFIGSSHEDPEIAYQLAQSTMDTYIQWKINVSQFESAEAQGFFAELVESYRSTLEPLRNSLIEYYISHPEPVRGERPALEVAEIERIQSDINLAENRVSKAEENEENARLALTQAESDVHQTYLIFDSPVQSTDPLNSLTDMAVTFIVFLVAGFFLSLLGIMGGVFLNRSVLFPLDVQQSFDLPVLASIPEVDQVMLNGLLPEKPQALRSIESSMGQHDDYDFTLPVRVPTNIAPPKTNGAVSRQAQKGDKVPNGQNGFIIS